MSFQTDLYDAMLADIYVLTKRPDLEEETELALRTATRNAHHSDFYNRDHATQVVQLPNAAYQASLDIQNLLPRFRGVESIVPIDVNGNAITATGDGNQIEVVEIGDIYDYNYKTLRNNIAYVAGTNLNIRTSWNSYGFIIGYYQSPLTRREQYNSWIAQLYDPVIVYWAASIVLNTNGNEEKANKYLKQVMEQYIPYLKANYLLGKAR